jgi:hypothetical protein
MNLTNYKVALSPLFFFLPLKNLMNYKSSLWDTRYYKIYKKTLLVINKKICWKKQY